MAPRTDFPTLMADFDAGVFVERVDAAIRAVALGVVTTGKKGRMTIKLDLERIGDSNQVTCTHAVTFAAPTAKGKTSEEATTKTPLYVGKGGALSLFPEEQMQMFAAPTTSGAAA